MLKSNSNVSAGSAGSFTSLGRYHDLSVETGRVKGGDDVCLSVDVSSSEYECVFEHAGMCSICTNSVCARACVRLKLRKTRADGKVDKPEQGEKQQRV